MSNMISVASGFQYSVNIGYDLNNDDKLKNFIPTQSALTLLEDILLSTRIASTDRLRTLFTFLSADGTSTLPQFLADYDDKWDYS